MGISIEIDGNLVKEALKFSDIKSKKELMQIALSEFIENRKRKNLFELKGKIKFFDDYDYKKMREGI